MIWVDIAIIALLAIHIVAGVIRGFSQEVFTLIAWVAGIFVAWLFSQDFAIFLLKVFSPPSARLAVAFVSLILITVVIGAIIKVLLAKAVKKTGLNFLDRLGGLLLGLVHGLVVVFVLVVVAGLTALPKDRWWQESKYIPPFQSLAILVKDNIPSTVASSINYR
ncbi:CvpA family protein [Methyloglobulus sp.]|uniref:CvpA family protein n=1 Tax=Methyloglobulus sp. TaxID=2518622 RepID=UPI00398A23FF